MVCTFSRRRSLASGAALTAVMLCHPGLARTVQQSLPIPPPLDSTCVVSSDLKIRKGAWSFLPEYILQRSASARTTSAPPFAYGADPSLTSANRTRWKWASRSGALSARPGRCRRRTAVGNCARRRLVTKLEVVQPATTCLYHSHTPGRTSYQIYYGLAGMMIIDDDEVVCRNFR